MGSRSKPKNGRAHVTVPGRMYGRKRQPKKVTFTTALESLLHGFRPDPKSEVAPEVQLANAKAERSLLFASKHTLAKHVDRVLARPRTPAGPRPRVERRRQKRALEKLTRATEVLDGYATEAKAVAK